MVGDGIAVMTSMEMQRQLTSLEDSKFKLEMRKLDLTPGTDDNAINLIDMRVTKIDEDISKIKK